MTQGVYAADPRPLVAVCPRYACQNFSRAYLRHLINQNEMLAGTLLSIHNIHILLQLSRELRQAILAGKAEAYVRDQVTG